MIYILLVTQIAFGSWLSFLWDRDKSDIEKKDKKEGSSIVLEEEYTPVGFDHPNIEIDMENSEPWQKPNYKEKSKGSLGYSENSFKVPKGLEEQVDFWKKIYTEYSSWQGVLHDSEHINHIYTKVDFTEIMKNPSYTDGQKRKKKRQLVRDKKKEVVARLRRLHKLDGPEGLSGEDLRVWKMYEEVEEKNKFIKSSKKGRLRFQLGQSDYFLKGIYRSGRYIRKMTEIFEEYNLPIELTRMPFVESSFNLNARSRVGASGIWQFMPATGKMYMKVNALVDYRNDPIESTKAAAKKLRSNYKLTDSWPLAITGYNHGPYGIARLSKKLKTKDLVEIIERERKRHFGFASRNFYASYLAALHVEEHADQYFENPRWLPELEYTEYKIKRNLRYNTVKAVFDEYKVDFDLYNPQFTRYTTKRNGIIYRAYLIYLPKEHSEKMSTALNQLAAPELKMAGKNGFIYEVRPGDTLSEIAEAFGVRVHDILENNNLSSSRIYSGQTLKIPN